MLAWVTSENSTSIGMPTSFDSIFFAVAGPSLLCYCLRSRPHLPVVPRQLFCWLASLLSCHQLPVSVVPPPTLLLTHLSAVQSPTACQLLCPANSLSRPLTTPGYGEISGPKILYLVSRQNRPRNRLLWWATHIVLHIYAYILM